MQMSQEILGQFRRKRLAIAGFATIAALVLILTFRFVEEKQRIERLSYHFGDVAIKRFDRLFSPLDIAADTLLNQTGTCSQLLPILTEKLAVLQILRSVLLVNDGRLSCASFRYPQVHPFDVYFPGFSGNERQMQLANDEVILKGSPVLLLWTPRQNDVLSGVLQVINIEMMIGYLLEPAKPWVERAVLNVNGKSLEYGNPLIEPVLPAEDQVSRELHSLRYPYSITLFGPAPSHMALTMLPGQLPLALLLSLLVGYIVWLATASRVSLSWQISYGIMAREFKVYCQPLIDARSGRCKGIELLLRWHTRRQGWISPDVFIPLAEAQNLIAPLTRFVIGEAVQALPTLPKTTDFHVAINVAASHFSQRTIIDDLQRLWWPANPQLQLIVELTERDALPAVDQQVVSHLRQLGVKLAIDDFGTGHSSLAYLKTLSPDVLKIDKVFTAAIGTDAINATVTDMVISLAQQLKMDLIAEGVETAAQADYLCRRGVNTLQGYFYARPMPLGEFPAWLTEYNGATR